MLGSLVTEDRMTLTDPFKDVLNLAQRFQQGALFRQYVMRRMGLVIPAAFLMIVTSLAFAFGTVLFIGGTRPLLVLLALLVAPLVLAGSLLVQAYVFLGWLEGRALAKTLGHRARGKPPGLLAALARKHLDADMGAAPPVPWALALIFLAVPLLMLMASMPALAIVAILLHIAGPVVFARLDC